jgi:DNA polymerase-3 subunit delta
MYDNQLPEWTQELLQTKGLTITQKGLALLVDHIGNDLTRIENEIDKLAVNLGKRTGITEDDIENYIGVSKEFNVFELQSALASKNLPAAIRIIQYFEANPKAAPVQLILPSLYSFFSKVFMIFGAGTSDEKTIATAIGVNPYFMKEYLQAAKLYSYPGVEKALLLLSQYNLKSIGVGDAGTEDASLLKEMVVKMMG